MKFSLYDPLLTLTAWARPGHWWKDGRRTRRSMGSVWILWSCTLAGRAGDGRAISCAYNVLGLSSSSFGSVCTCLFAYLLDWFSPHAFPALMDHSWAYTCLDNQIDALAARTGRWIFRGYVHAGDFWVGRWRETSTLITPMGFEGGFTLVRDW